MLSAGSVHDFAQAVCGRARLRRLGHRGSRTLTSVPVMPMATPMSASFRAGASFTPSPVIATTSPISFSNRTMSCSRCTRIMTKRTHTDANMRLVWCSTGQVLPGMLCSQQRATA